MGLHLTIMTPDQIFMDETVEEVILPTNTGQMGVLSQHASLITALDIGVMSVRNDSNWRGLALMNGFALVQKDVLTVLVNGAESKTHIDVAEARASYADAETQVNRAVDRKETVEAALAFKRARTRLTVANESV